MSFRPAQARRIHLYSDVECAFVRSIPLASVLFLVLWLLACGQPTGPSSDGGSDTGYRDVDKDIGISMTAPDATLPPHDVTPVCADDADGCQDADVPSYPAGNQPPNRNMDPRKADNPVEFMWLF